MFKVRLINKDMGGTAQQFPVCGKSGKLYGQAVYIPHLGGPVFEMTLADYDANKFDIIGNMIATHQWVPEFYVDSEIRPLEVHPVSPELRAEAESNPRKERSILQRAKDAGVYKRGMSEQEMKLALGFPD